MILEKNTDRLAAFLLLFFVIQLFVAPLLASVSDAVLVNYQTNLQIKNNRLYIVRSFELLVNNRQGEKYTEISIPYSKMNKVSGIDAFIKDKNGKVVKTLKSSDIKVRSTMEDFSFYEDNFVKEFSIVHNEYPYTLCYKYQEQQDEFFNITNWSPLVYKDVPTVNAVLTLDVPIEYKVNILKQFVDSSLVDTNDASMKYIWKASYLKQIDPEIYIPDISGLIPMVMIVPDKFRYDKEGSNTSWKTYGNWEYHLIEGLDQLPSNEMQQINTLIGNVKDDKEKVKILYHYLQDVTRYINISVETGGMKPHPASYVATNKYGDCKALANYFKSILSFVGIQSYYANIYAGDLIKTINLSFPSMQFNHAIVCVPFPNDTLWLDCANNEPFNYAGTFIQNRQVLLTDKDNSFFACTPALSKYDVLESRKVVVEPDSINGAIAKFVNTYRGKNYERLLGLSNSLSESQQSQLIRMDFIEKDLDLLNYKITPVHRDSAFIKLNYKATADKLFKKYGNEQLIRVFPFSIPAFREPKMRKYPVQIDYPVYGQDTLEYVLPKGYVFDNSFKDKILNSDFGTYTLQYRLRENSVQIIKSFLLNAGKYTLEQYPDFYNFIDKVSDIECNNYIVTKKHS